MSKTARYQSLTIKRKFEIIDKVDSLPPGKKKKDIAAECGIPASTLSTILKSRESLLSKHVGSNTKKRHRDATRLVITVKSNFLLIQIISVDFGIRIRWTTLYAHASLREFINLRLLYFRLRGQT